MPTHSDGMLSSHFDCTKTRGVFTERVSSTGGVSSQITSHEFAGRSNAEPLTAVARQRGSGAASSGGQCHRRSGANQGTFSAGKHAMAAAGIHGSAQYAPEHDSLGCSIHGKMFCRQRLRKLLHYRRLSSSSAWGNCAQLMSLLQRMQWRQRLRQRSLLLWRRTMFHKL